MKEISLESAEDDLGGFGSSLIIIPTIFHVGRRVTLRAQSVVGGGGVALDISSRFNLLKF